MSIPTACAGIDIEKATARQDVQRGAGDGQHLTFLPVEVVGDGVSPVDDGDHVAAEDLERSLAVDEHGGVLIKPDANQTRGAGEDRQQPAHPPALAEVLVDDDVLQQSEAGHDVDHPFARGRPIGVAADPGASGHHQSRQDRGAGTGAGDDDAIGVAHPDALHDQCADEQLAPTGPGRRR